MHNRYRKHYCVLIFFCSMLFLSSCKSSDDSSASTTSSESVPTAVLNDSTILISFQRDEWVVSIVGNTWYLREIYNDIKIGSILLLDDDAVRVTAAKVANGATVIEVLPAEIEEVFSEVDLFKNVDLSNATLVSDETFISEVDAELVDIPLDSQRILERKLEHQSREITTGLGKSLRIPINKGPFSGSVDFTLIGDMGFSYNKDNNIKSSGFLNVTGSIDGIVNAKILNSGSFIREYKVRIIRIPVTITLLDKALRKVGLRIASIMVPVILGLEGNGSYNIDLTLKGNANSNLLVKYDDVSNLSVDGPNNSADFEITGNLPTTGPDSSAVVKVDVGQYVKIRPQLLLLNKVASMGADVKVGMYGEGQLSVYLEKPYYCLQMTPVLKAGVSGFFKAVGINEQRSSTINRRLIAGSSLVEGECRKEVKIKIINPKNDGNIPIDDFSIPVSFSVEPVLDQMASNNNTEENPAATGTVSVNFQGGNCFSRLTDQQGNCDVSITLEGNDQLLSVNYSGDDTYRESKAEIKINIGNKAKAKILKASCRIMSTLEAVGRDHSTDNEYQEVIMSGTVKGPINSLFRAAPHPHWVLPKIENISCGAWSKVSGSSPPMCVRNSGDPAKANWTATMVGSKHTRLEAHVYDLSGSGEEHIDNVRGILCPGSMSYQ